MTLVVNFSCWSGLGLKVRDIPYMSRKYSSCQRFDATLRTLESHAIPRCRCCNNFRSSCWAQNFRAAKCLIEGPKKREAVIVLGLCRIFWDSSSIMMTESGYALIYFSLDFNCHIRCEITCCCRRWQKLYSQSILSCQDARKKSWSEARQNDSF
jgi:hypothetical protein